MTQATADIPASGTIFEEMQFLHQNLVVRYLVPISTVFSLVLALTIMLAQGVQVAGLSITLLVGLGVPIALSLLSQRTTITEAELRVRSVIGWGLKIPTSDIESADAISYNPIGDCGGWGLRKSKKHGLVFNVSGHHGVHVRYTADGTAKSMLIGSLRSDELARAIRLAADLPDAESIHGEAS